MSRTGSFDVVGSISWRMLVALALAGVLVVERGVASDRPTPPTQPATGPGGVERAYPNWRSERVGDRPTGYWLFEPLDASGAPPTEPVPLVIFLHGFTAVDPDFYGAWIDHIVRGGAVVVFPFYQTLNPLTLRPSEYLANAQTAIADAVERLGQSGRARIDSARTAVVGHSAGGVLAVNYAATAAANGLPAPIALMPVEPGGCRGCSSDLSGRFGISLEDLSTLDPSIRAIVVAGDADGVVGTEPARHIWESMTSLAPGNRDYVLIRSDAHGRPALRANHLMPLDAPFGSVDALDWYGAWKLLDGLLACAFDGAGCADALGGTPFQTFMGVWSDGTPVVPAEVESA